METLYALIFVQGFIWGILLLKKSHPVEAWLGISFLVLGVLYFLDYSEGIYDLGVPMILKFICILALLAASVWYMFKRLSLSDTGYWKVPSGVLLLLLLLIVLQVLMVPQNGRGTWLLAGSAGILSLVANAVLLIRRIRQKTHTGSILDLSNYLLHFHLLALVALVTLLVLMNGTSRNPGGGSGTVAYLMFQALLAVVVFSTGYHAVQFSYRWKPVPKKQQIRDPANDKGNQLIQLMEEKKPYLDCELTLGKVAYLLDMSEHELSTLLHTEMQTSFYDLINGYRIAAVKEKLLEPDSKKYTILSAAWESGFNSSSTFYRIFKEHTGMQPKEFVQRNS